VTAEASATAARERAEAIRSGIVATARCKWPGCLVPLVYSGRGRPPEYCPEHAAESKRLANKAWRDRPAKAMPPCCRDARLANPRRRICPQHQQWRRFVRDTRAAAGTRRDQEALGAFAGDYSPGATGADRNFRVAANPDSWWPREGKEINIIDRETNAWLALHPLASG
jgi:hypothetical protein